MAIPQADKPCNNSFAKMSHLYKKYHYLDTLSMGMSKDFVMQLKMEQICRIGRNIWQKSILITITIIGAGNLTKSILDGMERSQFKCNINLIDIEKKKIHCKKIWSKF